MAQDNPDRFWSHVSRGAPDDCWPWLAYIDEQGYGRGQWEGRVARVHRVAYELSVGPIPDGHEVDHRCHSPAECTPGPTCPHRRCVNPAHLEAVTPLLNSQRARGSVTHCVKGHPYDAANTYHHPSRGRQCRACTRASGKAYRDRLKEGRHA